ncbi:MAG TPA: envelope stress response membrane protein PspC [Gammaproteobacteria bacterium]|nr:envelope stress response membrane protein PspC [Gammaproteobacteria bacterium]
MNAAAAGARGGNRLYRNPRRGVIFGVCAGLSEYFAFDLTIVRVLVVLGAFFSFPVVPLTYLVLGFVLPVKPNDDALSDASQIDSVQRRVRSDPHDMLSSVRYRARDLDARLQRLEKYVTSNRFKLDQEFQRLRD